MGAQAVTVQLLVFQVEMGIIELLPQYHLLVVAEVAELIQMEPLQEDLADQVVVKVE